MDLHSGEHGGAIEITRQIRQRGTVGAVPTEGTNMITTPVGSEFRDGDSVVLAEGTYQGTPGRFLRLKDDPNWADITQRNGNIRSHPVAWLAHNAVDHK